MKRLTLALLLAATPFAHAQDQLKVTFIDVEGGQATLFVTPTGQSLLVDAGWPGNDGRDADRIAATAKQAGLSRIDYVLLTHYHADHAGGVPQLIAKLPVGTFIDHGPNREFDHDITEKDYAEYQKILSSGKYKHITAKPGDRLPLTGVDAEVITADGQAIDKPLAGAGAPDSFCDASEIRPDDKTENSRSLGIEITLGKFKILDLGDLTWDKERALMCPINKLGRVDVLIVSHHGWVQSSSPALVHAVHPRVAIMDNGAKKGGTPATIKSIQASPGLEALYQIHFSEEAGATGNTDPRYIANPQGTDAANSITLEASSSGSFKVTNGRTHETQTFK